MGSLEKKNGSAVENIDGIAKAEKTDPEKGGDGNERTFGVEKVFIVIKLKILLHNLYSCSGKIIKYHIFRTKACGSSSRFPWSGRFASTQWCQPAPS